MGTLAGIADMEVDRGCPDDISSACDQVTEFDQSAFVTLRTERRGVVDDHRLVISQSRVLGQAARLARIKQSLSEATPLEELRTQIHLIDKSLSPTLDLRRTAVISQRRQAPTFHPADPAAMRQARPTVVPQTPSPRLSKPRPPSYTQFLQVYPPAGH